MNATKSNIGQFLIQTDTNLYAKRIVREVNQIRMAGKSVYVSVPGRNIRVKKVSTCAQSAHVIVEDYDGFTHKVLPTSFIDESGAEICATRKP